MCIVYLQMNNKTQKLNVLATIAMVAAISILSGFSTVSAHTPNTLDYGALGHFEDESHFYHDGMLYVNVVESQGNGFFMSESDIKQEYTVDNAIQRFGIDEDVNSFQVQPSIYSDVKVIYMFNDETLTFQLLSIY